MSNDPKINKDTVTDFRPRVEDLERVIRALALDTGNVSWSDHVLDQMYHRDISDADVLKVLREGDLNGEIVAGRSTGEWKCKMVARIKGKRDVGVATIVCNGKRLFLKTAEWEDLR